MDKENNDSYTPLQTPTKSSDHEDKFFSPKSSNKNDDGLTIVEDTEDISNTNIT
jgi:hypothetical protein